MAVLVCDDTTILSSSYREVQGLLEAANRYDAAVGVCKAMSALISDEQRQTVLFDGESLKNVDKFRYCYYGLVVSRETNRLPFAVFDDYSAFANSCPLQTDTFLFPLIHSHNVLLSSNKF